MKATHLEQAIRMTQSRLDKRARHIKKHQEFLNSGDAYFFGVFRETRYEMKKLHVQQETDTKLLKMLYNRQGRMGYM